MQKRMRSAHPRTPGGRNWIPPGNTSGGIGGSKYMPVKQPKAPPAVKPARYEDTEKETPGAA